MNSKTRTLKPRQTAAQIRDSATAQNRKGGPGNTEPSRAKETTRLGEQHLQVILVPGMHRSGTSAVTRALNLLGASLPSNLMPALPGNNERGFWESLRLMDLHDELLEELASSWDDPTPFPESWLKSAAARRYEKKIAEFLTSEFRDSSLCVIKDPRTCRFLSLWDSSIRKVGAEPLAVIPYRHPVEVARSLKSRDKLSTAHSHLMWLRHVLLAERDSRSMKRTFVDYGRFIDDWQTSVNRVTQQLNIIWPCNVIKANNDIDSFLERQQRHHVETLENLDTRDDVPEWVKRIYKVLPRLDSDPADADAMREFDRVREEVSKADATFSPVLRSYRDANIHLEKTGESLEAKLSEQKLKLTELQELLAKETTEVERLKTDLAVTSNDLHATKSQLNEAIRRADRLKHKQNDLREIIASVTARSAVEDKNNNWKTAMESGPETSDLASPRIALGGISSGGRLNRFVQWLVWTCNKEKFQIRQLCQELIDSGLFDHEFYRNNNPDVIKQGVNSVLHYIEYGAAEGRWPNPLFDNAYYAQQLSPGELGDLNPLAHFMYHGVNRGINPHPLFDTSYYLENNPDLAMSGMNPLAHYLRYGWKEHRNPSIYFDGLFYEAQLQRPVTEIGIPLLHYIETGAIQGLDPHPLFSTEYYLSNNKDIREAGVNPLIHYIKAGASEERNPHRLFDLRFYLGQFQDETEAPSEPLRHYLENGALCGFNPNPNFDSAFYLSQDPDLVNRRVNPLSHYVRFGADEGRTISRESIPLDEGKDH